MLGLGRNTKIDSVEDNWEIDPMSDETIKGYLINSSVLLKEQYIEAKKSLSETKDVNRDYRTGERLDFR